MPRVAVLALASLLLLGTPAWRQTASAEEIEKLIAELGDEEWFVRRCAAEDLGKMGPKAAPAVPALIMALSVGEDAELRSQAAVALGEIGTAPTVPALIAALSDKEDNVRDHAAYALGAIGPKAVPALAASLSDKNANVRTGAALALCSIGHESAPAVPALIAALSDEDAEVRGRAAIALAMSGPEAAPAVPALITALSDGDEWARGHATSALGKIGTDLKAQGTVLAWVIPRVFWKELVGLVLLLVAWFALAARVARHLPATKLEQVALTAFTAATSAALACSCVYYAISREWAQGFLPDTLTLVPFPAAAVLSTAFLCVLAAIWACQRKPVEGSSEPGARTP